MYEHGRGVRKSASGAAKWYLLSAEQGLPSAQSNLASLYFAGHGVKRDYGQAALWVRKAAESGLPLAQRNLGYLYSIGRGVGLDYVQAAKWTRRAADQGYAPAETDLGRLYEQGNGVPLDYVAAYAWYSIGAAGGDHRAMPRIKALSQIMEQRQIREARTEALSRLLDLNDSKILSNKEADKTELFNCR
jgi:TPR repeat protein